MRKSKVFKRICSFLLSFLLVLSSLSFDTFTANAAGIVDGTTVSTPEKGTTYEFDFQQNENLATSGTYGLLTIEGGSNYRYHGSDHGVVGSVTFTIQVAGNCKISMGSCCYTGSSDVFKASSETGAFDATQKAAQTAKCWNVNNNGEGDTVDFYYVGDAGSVSIQSTGYVPHIMVTPLADDYQLAVWAQKNFSLDINGTTVSVTGAASDTDKASISGGNVLYQGTTEGIVSVDLGGKTLTDALLSNLSDNITAKVSGYNVEIAFNDSDVKPASFTLNIYDNGLNATPAFGETTFYNFSDESVIPKVFKYGDFLQTITSRDGLLTVNGNDSLYHNGGEIAIKEGISFDIKVPGNADISFQQCLYGSGGNLVVSGVPEGATVSADSIAFNGTACKNEASIRYEGPATTLTFSVTGSGYLHGMTVTTDAEQTSGGETEDGDDGNTEVTPSEPTVTTGKIDIWDIGAKAESGSIYNNHITQEAWAATGLDLSTSLGTTTVTFGDAQLVIQNGDKICGSVGQDASASKYTVISYPDGYTSTGVWHTNGKGGTGRRCVILNNVKAGDRISAYMGSHTVEEDQLHFMYMGSDGTQNDGTDVLNRNKDMINNGGVRYDFVAKYDGQYKLYVDATTNLKPVWHRIVRVPAVNVTGNVDLNGTGVESFGIKFINNTTEDEIVASVNGTGFSATLTPGYEYTAVMTGVVGTSFTYDSKTISVTDAAVESGMSGVSLKAEKKDVALFSGTLTGLEGYDMSNVKVILAADPASLKEDITMKIAEDMTFAEYIEPNVAYTITLENANDYMIANPIVNIAADTQQNIEVTAKPCYNVTGSFLNVPSDVAVTSLTFTNVEDGYTYTGTISGNGYSVALRDGAYSTTAVVNGYSTSTHVIVNGAEQTRDLLFVSTSAAPAIAWVSDIYVGYPEKENNYDSVRDAVAACKAMNPTNEAQRITVHIAPGVYREQVIVEAPYVSFVNDEPSKEVKLTWYYGVGYKYYSAGAKQYYDEERAYDKYEKNTVTKWGSATYIKSTAIGFRAENITFENSFNRYLTEEELADGIEVSGESTAFIRERGVDVVSSAAKERAAALALEANHAEFYNCKILGGQDTMYTGGNIVCYLKDCLIEGNTDYIFGNGNIVFDECELSFYGFSDSKAGGYITAASEPYRTGYIFNNCTVTADANTQFGTGYFGRPWRQEATVCFINTKIADSSLIDAKGWTSMSGSLPENANFTEFNTTYMDGTPVDMTSRTSGTVVTENPIPDLQTVFSSWAPYYYGMEEAPDEEESSSEIESSTVEESSSVEESSTEEESSSIEESSSEVESSTEEESSDVEESSTEAESSTVEESSSEEESSEVEDSSKPAEIQPSKSESSSSKSSANTSKPSTQIKDEEVPLAESAVIVGEYLNVNLSQEQMILRIQLFEKYHGMNLSVLAHLGNGIGYTIDTDFVANMTADVQLGASLSEIKQFAQGFATYRVIPAQPQKFARSLTVHVHVGEEHIGKTAYIFSLDSLTGQFVRKDVVTVSEIGNVALTTSELSQIMVMIEK